MNVIEVKNLRKEFQIKQKRAGLKNGLAFFCVPNIKISRRLTIFLFPFPEASFWRLSAQTAPENQPP